MNKVRRVLSLLLTAGLLLSLFAGLSLTSFAEEVEVDLFFSGAEVKALSGVAGEAVTLPGAQATQDGYVFLGWTEQAVSQTTTEPVCFAPGSSYILPDEDTTLFALYSFVDHRGTPSYDRYVKVTSAAELKDGTYLIGVEKNGSLLTFNGSMDEPNTSGNYATLSLSSNTVEGNADSDACAVRVAKIEGTDTYGIQMKNGEGKYVGSLGKSGLNTRQDSPYPLKIEFSGSDTLIYVGATDKENTNYYLSYYETSSNHKIAFYNNTQTMSALAGLYRKIDGIDGTLYYTGTPVACTHEGTLGTSVAPTCVEAGYTGYLCQSCGYKWTTPGGPAAGHNYLETVVDPTEGTPGYTLHTCSVCGDSYQDNETDPLGEDHRVTFWTLGNPKSVTVNSYVGIELTPPTIIPDGFEFAGWSFYEYKTEQENVTLLTAGDLTGDDLSDGKLHPFYDMTLYAVYVRAGDDGSGDYVKVTETPAAWDGQYLVVCESSNIAFNSAFGTTATNINKANNYLPVTIANGKITATEELDAASVEIGQVEDLNYYMKVNCGLCVGSTGSSTANGLNAKSGTVYENTITLNDDGTVAIANAAETNTGSNIYNFAYNSSSVNKFCYCKPTTTTVKPVSLYRKEVFSGVFYTSSPSTAGCEHGEYSAERVAPTCVENGYTLFTCINCSYSWTDNETEALGHVFDTGVVTQPTQTTDGYTTYTCQRAGCGYSEKRDYVGWSYEITFVKPDGTETTETADSYNGVALPTDAPAYDGYTFAGWLANELSEETPDAEPLTGIYKPTQDITLYAAYGRNLPNEGTGEYVKVEAGSKLVIDGRYLLVSETDAIAFNGAADDCNAKGNYIPFGSAGTVEAYDAAAVTISPIEGTVYYAMQLFNASYIGNTGSSTGINHNTKSNYINAINLNEEGYAVITNVGGAAAYQLRYNSATSSDKFGFYALTNKTCHDITLYYKDGSGFTARYTTKPVLCYHANATSVVTDPTCTEAGYTTYTCPDCQYSWTGAVTEALGHTYPDTYTCNNDGTHSRICTVCRFEEIKNCSYDKDTHLCKNCGFPQPCYTVTYNAAGTVTTEAVYGSTTLPAAEDAEGYEFVGWSDKEIAVEVAQLETEPLNGKYEPEGDVTLYAVYVRAEEVPGTGTGTGNYIKVTSTDDLAEGQYLIVYEKGNIAFNAGLSDTQTGLAVKGNYLDATVSNNTIEADYLLDNAAVTIKPVGSNYSLKTVYDKYLGSTGKSTGINMSATTEYQNTITIAANGVATITNAAETSTGENVYKLCYNDLAASDRFGFYSTSGTSANHAMPIALYKKDGTGPDISYFYTTVPVAAPEETELRIKSAYLKLDEDIDVVYTAVVPADYTDAYMIFEMHGETFRVEDDGSHKFVFEGVNPQCIDDTITATLIATCIDEQLSTKPMDYSVATYCEHMLADTSLEAKTRALISSVLCYGEAAKAYMGYETEESIDSIEIPTLSGLAPIFTGDATDEICWTGAGLTLTNSVAMDFRFYAEDIAGLSIKVRINGREETFTEFTEVAGTDLYEISFCGIKAEEFADTVTASFWRGSTQVGNTVSYSVNTYICAKQNDTNETLANLVRALYIYGLAAAAYAG